MARKRKNNFGSDNASVDMSPMIDLVFLLLIFFMIVSTTITYNKIEGVTIPIAYDSKVPELATGRVIINVFPDGRIVNESGNRELSLGDVEQVMAESKAANPITRLHLRADKNVAHEKVKEVIAASARGGVSSVIFSTYQTE